MTRTCCINLCPSKYPDKENGNLRTLLQLPLKDEEARTKIVNQIGIHFKKRKPGFKTLFICDLHFEESCFNKEPATCMIDGKIVMMQRQRLFLKKDALPTIFPEVEQNIENIQTNREMEIKPNPEFAFPAKYMDTVCRVCLTEQTLLISMYEIHLTHNLNPQGTIESVPLSAVFEKYCNVTINFFDKKPQKICVSCMKAVHTAFNFFELFLQSNATLEKMIQTQNVEVPQCETWILPEKPIKKSNTLPDSSKSVVRKNMKKNGSSSVAHAKPIPITVNNVEKNGKNNINIDLSNVNFEVNTSTSISQTTDPLKIEEGSQNLDKEVAAIMDNALKNVQIIKNEVVQKEKRPHRDRVKTPPYFLNDPTGSLRDHSYLMSEKYFNDLQKRRLRKRKIRQLLKKPKKPKPEKPKKKPKPPPSEDYRQRQRQLKQQLHDKDIFNCRFCRITLNGIDTVLQHVKDKHADSKRCILCPSIAKKLMMYHVAAHSKNSLVCRICRLYFEDKESFLNHKTEFDHNDMLTCQECGKKFKTMSNRRSHSIVHKDKNKIGLQCSQCGLIVKYAANLVRHERSHLEIRKRKTWLCQICGRSYTAKWSLEMHVKSVHEGQTEFRDKMRRYQKFHRLKRQGQAPKSVNDIKPPKSVTVLTCDYCPRTFTHRHSYMTHMLSHPECKDIPCWYCSQVFETAKAYRAHQEAEHRTFRCEPCKKGFAHKYMLDWHIKTHTARFKCEFCDRPFTTQMTLTIHRRIHTGERPFCCDRCDKSFKQPSQLTHHVQCMHTNKNHKCKVCGKAFNFPYGLQAHMRSHTGEKPFACLYCDRRYRDTVSRHKHVKRDHPENLEKFIEYKKSHQGEETKEVRINSDVV